VRIRSSAKLRIIFGQSKIMGLLMVFKSIESVSW
jgi:hypothetical protein